MPSAILYRLRSRCLGLFVNYSSIRQIEIPNTFVAVIHRILQLLLLVYIFLYIVWKRNGYQHIVEPRGSSVIKVKGVGRVSINNANVYNPDGVNQALWDASEYGIPPLEENAFFIATRKLITYSQVQGICPSTLNESLSCNLTNNPCIKGVPTDNAFSFLTGRCVPSFENRTRMVCEINAWCPVESSNSSDTKIMISDLRTFTVYIKTIVSFPEFKLKLRTVNNETNFSCRFDSNNNSQCPIFRIGYILQKLQDEKPTTNLKALCDNGGLIEIRQDWKCNFDRAKVRNGCFPSYTFELLHSGDDQPSPGINYRFADKYQMNGIEYRTLTKMYGLRFILTITGEGRKFDPYILFLGFGSGIGFLAIADLVCEFIFMHMHKNNVQFRQNKIAVCNLVGKVNDSSIKS